MRQAVIKKLADKDKNYVFDISDIDLKAKKINIDEAYSLFSESGLQRLLAAKSQNSSNGHLERKLFEQVRMIQALRTSNNIITDVYIQAALAEVDISVLFERKDRNPIGFKM